MPFEIFIALFLSLLLYIIPIWWLLRTAGWRSYLQIRRPWLGVTAELVTALLLGIGMLYIFPQPLVWIFSRLLDITGNAEYVVFGIGHRHWKDYIYPVAILAFLGYLWKKRNRVK